MGVGAQHCPLGLHALVGLRAAGVVGGCPRGGWPAIVVRGVWCQALSLPRPPVLWSGQPGFCDPCVPGSVGAGVGTLHRPHGAHPCGPALRVLGLAVGRPRGGCRPPCDGRLGSNAPPPPAARPLGGLPGLADHVLWARLWVCAVCVVSVRCVSWRAVPLSSCPSGAPLSGASVRCCARRVPAVPPSLRASLARLLATPCFFRGFVALYPFLYPSPWHAIFPCLRSGACLGLFPCRLVVLSCSAFSFGPVKRKDANGRAAAGVLSCHGTLSLPSSVGLLLLRWCGMLPTYGSYVFSPFLFLTVLCLLRRILACVVWRRFVSYLHSTRLHTPLWPPFFVVRPSCAA